MIKKLITSLLLFFVTLASAVTNTGGNRADFNARYIRTDGYYEGAEYPVVTVISTKEELDKYCEKYETRYDLISQSSASSGASTGFLGVVENYTESFFESNFLVIVLLEENSGSVRHEVLRVAENGDIAIKRLIPEIGTADMAEWNIIIELDNGLKAEQFNVVFVNESALAKD